MGSILRLLAAILLLTLPAGAAVAAPAESTLEPHLGGLTLAPGGPEKLTLLWVRATGDALTEHHFQVTVDYGAVAGFADVDMALGALSVTSKMRAADDIQSSPDTSDSPCTPEGTTFTCEWDDVLYTSDAMYAVALVVAEPKDSAVTGDSGKIQVTARIDDAAASAVEANVQVGEGVDLAAGTEQEVEAQPGGTASTTPVVRNAGSTPVDGVVMFLDADPRLLGDTSYSNCLYGDGEVVCSFDTTLAADQSYAVADPITLEPPADSVNGSQALAVVQWMTATEWADWKDALPEGFLGDAGTGDPLELTEVAAAQGAPQSDVEPRNDSGTITLTVTGADDPDLAALGAHVSGASSEVAIAVGTRNLGPGTLHPDLYPNNQVAAEIRLPGNVTAVDVDPRCGDRGDGYVCYATRPMAPGGRDTFTFALRVDGKNGSAGQIEVADVLPSIAGVKAAAQENNVASIVVTGSGAVLPVTGPDALRHAAEGAAFVVVGLLLAVRRHRRPVGAHAVRVTGRGRRRKGTAR